MQTATEKIKYSLIFSHEIFYVKIVLCLNILLPIIRFDYITRPLHKNDVIKVYSIEYLATVIELLLPTFKSTHVPFTKL